MSFQPAVRPLIEPPFLGPFSWNSIGPRLRGHYVNSPSASGLSANVAYYIPFYLTRPYDCRRFWWQNGSTVGTDYVLPGIYRLGAGVMEAVVTGGRILHAGTVNELQYTGAAVGVHPILSSTSTTDGTSFVTASTTLRARPGYMYALFFMNSKASAAEAATSVQTTSGAVTFTSRVSTTYGASTEGRVSMWTAVPTSDVTDTITITFSGTQTGCGWALVAFSNVDTTTNHGIVQTTSATGSSTTPSATLGALGDANAAVIGAHGNLADTSTTPGTGWSELYDINYATPTTCMQVEWATNDVTPDATITSGQWGSIAAEVKNLATTSILAPGAYYSALECSGTTATFFSLGSATLAPVGVYMETSAGGLPLVATPAATAILVNAGITNRASP